jgi:hypothetical protein
LIEINEDIYQNCNHLNNNSISNTVKDIILNTVLKVYPHTRDAPEVIGIDFKLLRSESPIKSIFSDIVKPFNSEIIEDKWKKNIRKNS